MTELVSKFKQLEQDLNEELHERSVEIHTAVLALLARKHHFQVGEPGVAKSLLVDRLSKRIEGLGDDGYFRWLLTNFTSPAELYGMPDPNLFKAEGVYKFKTDRKLPKAKIVFLDEIFKGSSSILNVNLTAMNERMFFNHDDDPKIPLITLFAASNEVPENGNLSAIWDRLHFRHRVSPISNHKSFLTLLSSDFEKDPAPSVSYENIIEAQELVKQVEITEEIYEVLFQLKKVLESENVYITDRRWKECTDIIKAEAFLNGRTKANTKDVRPLMHVLWNTEDEIMTTFREVLTMVSPLEKAASDILVNLLKVEQELNDAIQSKDANAISAVGTATFKKLDAAKPQIFDYRDKLRSESIESQIIVDVIEKYREIANRLQAAQKSLG